MNNCFSMTKDLESILEEGRFNRNEVFKISQSQGTFKQLPVDVTRKMREDQLMRIRHEVILVKFITNVLHRYLFISDITNDPGILAIVTFIL